MTRRPPVAVISFLFIFIVSLAPSFALGAEASETNLLESYFQEAERALAENRLADAARAYEKLRRLDPKTAEVHAKLGLIYYQQGRFAEAVPTLREASKLKPGLPNTDLLLAMCLSELGRHSEALPGLEKGFRHPPDPKVKRLVGLHLQRTYTELRRYHQALDVASELVRLYPRDAEVLYSAGRFFGDFSYLMMEKLSQVAPDSVWRHQAAGEAYESRGHYELALREYRTVLSMDPTRPGIHFRIGRTLLSHPDREDSQQTALKEFEQELQLNPTNASAAYEIGEISRKSGQLGKARQFFKIAVEHYPDFEDAQIGLGRVLIALKQPEKALAHLEKAISINAENEVSHYQLSLAHKALGNEVGHQRALSEFQRLRAKKLQSSSSALELSEVTRQQLEVDSRP